MKKTRFFALILSGVMALSLLTACGAKDNNADGGDKKVDLAELWSTIEEQYELPFLEPLDDETMESIYGIDPDLLNGYVAMLPVMNVHATEFFIADVKDGSMDTVTDALARRQEALLTQWEHYLPEQYALVENYKLQANGNYVLFCVSEHADAVPELFNDATK